jgi:hypothetical protein
MTQIMSPGCGHGTWIVIPAYNEERVMAGVIGEAVRSGHRVVLVDDDRPTPPPKSELAPAMLL